MGPDLLQSPAMSTVERADVPSSERLGSRETVVGALNSVIRRRRSVIEGIRCRIDPGAEIDALVNNPHLIHPEQTQILEAQRPQLAAFRRLEKQIYAASKGKTEIDPTMNLRITNVDPTDHQAYNREAEIDVSNLIGRGRNDIAERRRIVTDLRYQDVSYELERDLGRYQGELEVLEASSAPFGVAHPEYFDENGNLDEDQGIVRAIIAEEMWTIDTNPLAHPQGNVREGEDRQAIKAEAIQNILNSRILRLPAREEPRPEPPIIPITPEPPVFPRPFEPTRLVTPEPTPPGEPSVIPTPLPPEVPPVRPGDNGRPIPPEVPTEPNRNGIADRFRQARERADRDLVNLGQMLGHDFRMLRNIRIPVGLRRGILAALGVGVLSLILGTIPNDTFNKAEATQAAPNPSPVTLSFDGEPSESSLAPDRSLYNEFPSVPQPVQVSVPAPVPAEELSQNPPGEEESKGKASTEPVIIQPGDTIRGLIEKRLREVAPNASNSTIDRAASVATLAAGVDNERIINLDLVHPGEQVMLKSKIDLEKFMQNFDSSNPQIDEFNNIPKSDTSALKQAEQKANQLFDETIQ